jgi:CheY-like chemotaxis protein
MAEGHDVIDVSGGADALARLEHGAPFDAVFTDLRMPDMTGWQVARAVKARWPKLIVVVITGWQEDAQGDADDRAAVDFMISKPLTVEALRDVTRRMRPE